VIKVVLLFTCWHDDFEMMEFLRVCEKKGGSSEVLLPSEQEERGRPYLFGRNDLSFAWLQSSMAQQEKAMQLFYRMSISLLNWP
jgi:hypothetical protein